MSTATPRHSALDLLRGLASLAVVWFHLTNGNKSFLPEGALKTSGSCGWLGVEVFFVISGFIIPFALARSQYRLKDYGTFLLKRIVRLDPPYLISLGVVIALGYLSSAAPGFQGPPFQVSIPQLLLHLGYLNVFFGYPWLNPVFWTLAIELQYYLLIGLLFPLLAGSNRTVRWLTLLTLAILPKLFPNPEFLCYWLVLFLLGIVTFQYRAGLLNLRWYLISLAGFSTASFYYYQPEVAIVALAAACIIAFVETSLPPALLFFGHISYSLYLLHVPIGSRVINLGLRYASNWPAKLGLLFLGLLASMASAWLLHRYVERPAQRWSSSIGYRRGPVAPSGFGPRDA